MSFTTDTSFTSTPQSLVWNLHSPLSCLTDIMEKCLKLVPLLMMGVCLICQLRMVWSWPPRIRSIPLTDWASLVSLYPIMWVRAMMKLHWWSSRRVLTISSPYSTKFTQSSFPQYIGVSTSSHSSSASPNSPILNPPFSKMWYSLVSSSRSVVPFKKKLLSSHGKLVPLCNSRASSMGKSRSWFPKQATSMFRELRGLIICLPLWTSVSSEGENASPEKSTMVFWFVASVVAVLNLATPPTGSLSPGSMSQTSLKWMILSSYSDSMARQ